MKEIIDALVKSGMSIEDAELKIKELVKIGYYAGANETKSYNDKENWREDYVTTPFEDWFKDSDIIKKLVDKKKYLIRLLGTSPVSSQTIVELGTRDYQLVSSIVNELDNQYEGVTIEEYDEKKYYGKDI